MSLSFNLYGTWAVSALVFAFPRSRTASFSTASMNAGDSTDFIVSEYQREENSVRL